MSVTDKKTKKTYIMTLLMFLFVMLLFCGCSMPTATEIIKEDVAKHTGFTEILYEGLDINEISIIKRNTDKKNKLDEVWVSVTGRNEDIYAIRNYKLTYMLYNDGWRFEKYETYQDQDNYDQTNAGTSVTLEDAQEFLDTLDLNSSASFETILDIEVVGVDDIKMSAEDGFCEFFAAVKFTYPLLVEYVEIPLQFKFTPTDGVDANWKWNSYKGYICNRTLSFGEDFKGTWDRLDGRPFDVTKIEIISGSSPNPLEDNGTGVIWWPECANCYIENFYMLGIGYTIDSWATLNWQTNYDNGKLCDPCLTWVEWADKDNPYEHVTLYIYPDGIDGIDRPMIDVWTESWFKLG